MRLRAMAVSPHQDHLAAALADASTSAASARRVALGPVSAHRTVRADMGRQFCGNSKALAPQPRSHRPTLPATAGHTAGDRNTRGGSTAKKVAPQPRGEAGCGACRLRGIWGTSRRQWQCWYGWGYRRITRSCASIFGCARASLLTMPRQRLYRRLMPTRSSTRPRSGWRQSVRVRSAAIQ